MEKKKKGEQLYCEYHVEGMHCESCQLFVENAAKKQEGIKKVSISKKTNKLEIELEDGVDETSVRDSLQKKIDSQGYTLKDKAEGRQTVDVRKYLLSFIIALTFSVGLYLLQNVGFIDSFSPDHMTNSTAVVWGFLGSISTCMAVIGGIVLTFSASLAKAKKSSAILYFHIARIASFFILGGLTGLLGKSIVFSSTTETILETIVSIIMIIVALDMLDIRVKKVTFPKAISNFFGMFSDKDKITDAFLLGFGSYFLPCGITQAAQAQALQRGDFLGGAMLMLFFAIGTLPMLLVMSLGSASFIKKLQTAMFQYTLGFIILLTAIISLLVSH